MATALTSVFGSEITVAYGSRRTERMYHGFPGSHGVTSLHLGSRGYPIQVRGRLRATGADYDEARAALGVAIRTLEAYTWAEAEDYTYRDDTYAAVVWERLDLVPGPHGTPIRGVGGSLWCQFVMTGRAHV